jgi:N-acetylglucosaminyl-diphospho-decaprenol L-rhamnosyltransferase
MRKPDVSAVLVAWNAGPALASCTSSLREAAARAGVELQVVVVDNASDDGSVDEMALADGDVRIRNPLNAGYGVAAAQGMARAAGEWILLANPDLTVEPTFFRALAQAARDAPAGTATLVPEMRFAARREIVNCRGLSVDDIGVPAEVDAGVAAAEPAGIGDLLGGSSGCCLLRASAVKSLGGPEPAFFAYLEDVDLALRLQRAGYSAVFVAGAVAWHEGSMSTGRRSPLKEFLVGRNRRVLFALHGPWSLRARFWRTVTDAGHGLVTSRHGAGFAPWAGRLDALRLRRYVRFVRRSRAAHDPDNGPVRLAPRVTLRRTLARRKAIDSAHTDP